MSRYKCAVCDGSNVQRTVWVRLNTGEAVEETSSWDVTENWCEDCDAHVQIIDTESEAYKAKNLILSIEGTHPRLALFLQGLFDGYFGKGCNNNNPHEGCTDPHCGMRTPYLDGFETYGELSTKE